MYEHRNVVNHDSTRLRILVGCERLKSVVEVQMLGLTIDYTCDQWSLSCWHRNDIHDSGARPFDLYRVIGSGWWQITQAGRASKGFAMQIEVVYLVTLTFFPS